MDAESVAQASVYLNSLPVDGDVVPFNRGERATIRRKLGEGYNAVLLLNTPDDEKVAFLRELLVPPPQQVPQPLSEADIRRIASSMIPTEVSDRLDQAVFLILDESSHEPIGAGFCVEYNGQKVALTARHNFLAQCPPRIVAHFMGPHLGTVELDLIREDPHLDYCIFNVVPGAYSPFYLQGHSLPPAKGSFCALAAFQIPLTQQLGDVDPNHFLGLSSCHIMKVHHRHVIFSCEAFAGDSGAALLLVDGEVYAMHLETVNQAREAIRQGSDAETMDSVLDSLDSLTRGLSSGQVGLCLHAIFH
eukprot:TRINITY_DN888_c0_g1_i1.p1 TRINITY_DN888_c0_g1~~TRINITY_DN888_c0_g1_i1.p1  ORF type:complete len:315 (-),score=10.85 TRINITY_DN888_c0_g1_i1:119-1030(-)